MYGELELTYAEFCKDTNFHKKQGAKGAPPKLLLDALKDPTWMRIFYAWPNTKYVTNELAFLGEVLSYKENQGRTWEMAEGIRDTYLRGLISVKYKNEILKQFPDSE